MKQSRAQRRSERKKAAATGAGEMLIPTQEAALPAEHAETTPTADEREYSERIAEYLIDRDTVTASEAAAAPEPLTTLRAIQEMEGYLAGGGEEKDLIGFLAYLEAAGIR